MHLFYTPDITLPEYALSEEESKHCINVLRLQNKDIIYLVDGVGGFFTAQIINDHAKKCLVKIIEIKREFGKSKFGLHIAIAPTKNLDRFEWFLEKAIEIGINEITPIICEKSERQFIQISRLKRILIATIKQSKRAYLPVLNEAIKFNYFIREEFGGQKFIAHCHDDHKEKLSVIYKKGKDAIIMIGPEGDFSEQEIKQAKIKLFFPITLGESRLRTETAGIVACNTIHLLNEINNKR